MTGDKPDADDSLTIAGNAILCHDTNAYDERDARPRRAPAQSGPWSRAGLKAGGGGGGDYVDEEKRPLRS